MKKLFKLVLALTMVLSLAACSDDEEDVDYEDDDVVEDVIEVEGDGDDDEVEDVIEVEDGDWRDELSGDVERYTILYDGEYRDIILQLLDESTIYLYYDQDEEETIDIISVGAGEVELDTLVFSSNALIKYDDITFDIYDYNNNRITCEYDYNVDDECYKLFSFNSNEKIPNAEYWDTWCLNADLNSDAFSVYYDGEWVFQTGSGYSEKGYVCQDESGVLLYDEDGQWVGDLSYEDDTWLAVTLHGDTEYYARLSNSTAGQ